MPTNLALEGNLPFAIWVAISEGPHRVDYLGSFEFPSFSSDEGCGPRFLACV